MLTYKYTFNLITEKICLEDETDWSSLGFTVGTDVFKYLFKITSPLGAVVYETTGFSTDNYSSPDIADICKDLPTVTSGEPMVGEYIVEIKVDVNGTDQFTSTKTAKLCEKSLISENLEVNVNCDTSSIQTVDRNNYGVFDTIVREHNLFYPSALEEDPSTTTTAQNDVTPIYTGTWAVKVEATVTYLLSEGVYLVKLYETSKEFKVDCDSSLCKFLCCFTKYRARLIATMKTNSALAATMRLNYGLAFDEWNLARQMKSCGKEVSEDVLNNIYTLKKVGFMKH